MSTTHIKKLAGTRGAIDYQLYGAKGTDRYRTNKRLGTDRVVAQSMDAESSEAFVARAEALREANGRKIEALSIIQSFEKTEMDPDDPADAQKVNDLGYALAKKMYPNSDAHVITHNDGSGGHLHNHIVVLNHDNITGHALKRDTLHWQVARHNDELMLANGLGIPKGRGGDRGKSLDQSRYWELERDGASVTEFERQLGDTINEVLDDPAVVDLDGYRAALDVRGVELIEKKRTIPASKDGTRPEHESVGWTYKMNDETGEKVRSRRRKASALSSEFTHEGVSSILDDRKIEQQVHAQHAEQSEPEELGEVIELPDEPEVMAPTHRSPANDAPVEVIELPDESPSPVPEPDEELPADGGVAERRRREEAEAEEAKRRATTVREQLAQQRKARQATAAPDPVEQHTERLRSVRTEHPKVDVEDEVADVLGQSSDAYVRAAVSLPVKGGTVDDAVRGRLRQRAVAGTLPEDRSTAYEAEVKAFGPKVEAAVEKKVHRAWGDVYGAWGTRPGQMTEQKFRSKRYDGPGSDKTSRLQAQMKASEKGREVDRTRRRGLGE